MQALYQLDVQGSELLPRLMGEFFSEQESDERIHKLLACLSDEETSIRVRAERAFNHRLEGGCQVPIAGFAVLEGDELWMRGLVGRPDGSEMVRGEIRGPVTQAENLGIQLADDLLSRGADAILKDVYA